MANVRKLIGMADAFAARFGPGPARVRRSRGGRARRRRADAGRAARGRRRRGRAADDDPRRQGTRVPRRDRRRPRPRRRRRDAAGDRAGGTRRPAAAAHRRRATPDLAFDYAELDLERMDAEAREERRIMHVAVTRAERLLILSGTFRASKGWGDARVQAPGARVDGARAVRRGPRPSRRAPAACARDDAEATVVVNEPGGVLALPSPARHGCAGPGRATGEAVLDVVSASPAAPGPAPPGDAQLLVAVGLRALRVLVVPAARSAPAGDAGGGARHRRRVQRRGAPARVDRPRRARTRRPRRGRRRPGRGRRARRRGSDRRAARRRRDPGSAPARRGVHGRTVARARRRRAVGPARGRLRPSARRRTRTTRRC